VDPAGQGLEAGDLYIRPRASQMDAHGLSRSAIGQDRLGCRDEQDPPYPAGEKLHPRIGHTRLSPWNVCVRQTPPFHFSKGHSLCPHAVYSRYPLQKRQPSELLDPLGW